MSGCRLGDFLCGVLLVEFWLARVWSKWPLCIAIEVGRYFFKLVKVNPGNLLRSPFCKAAVSVDSVGEKSAAWECFKRSGALDGRVTEVLA